MKIGLAIAMQDDLQEKLIWAKESGFKEIQLQLWNMADLTIEHAQMVAKMLKSLQLNCNSLWCGWQGPISWTFNPGPAVLGLVPAEYRAARTETLLAGARYAKALGAEDVVTHLGFVPLNCTDRDYVGVVNAMRLITSEMHKSGQNFLMETGQEPPIVLKRLIQDVGADNLLINYDPANLMMYGSANPLDGLDMLRDYVRTVHAKDGSYPQNGYELGTEYPIGKGKVNFPKFLEKLGEIGFDGTLYVEHEIEVGNQQQKQEILEGKAYLEALLTKDDGGEH